MPNTAGSRPAATPATPGEHLRRVRERLVDAPAARDAVEVRVREEMRLHRDLLQRDDERAVREVFEREAGIEVAGVVEPTAGLGVGAGIVDTDARDLRLADDRHGRVRLDGTPSSGSMTTRQWQCGARSDGHARRPVDRPDLRVRVGRARGRVERRVLDVVAHAVHELLAHRLDVHQRTAVVEPELAVLRVVDLVLEVHELVRARRCRAGCS